MTQKGHGWKYPVGRHWARVFDDKAGHRDALMSEHSGDGIEFDLRAYGLNGGSYQPFPSSLPISETDFVQAFANCFDYCCGQRGVRDEIRRFSLREARCVRTIQQPLPNQTLFAEIHQKTRAKPPEFAVAKKLNQMLGSKLSEETFQLWDEVILDHKIRLKGVRDDSAINQVSPWFGKMRNSSRRKGSDKFLMIDILIKTGTDR